MIIRKVLNNNVAVIESEDGKERIVMGKGLAFKKKAGDEIDTTKVDKTFVLTSGFAISKFEQLIADIPLETVKLADQIITMAKAELGKSLNDSIYITLTDHIYAALTRIQEGVIVKNPILYDIKRFYISEYNVALEALDCIETQTGIQLPKDEAGFIALYLANAQTNAEDVKHVYEMTKVMQEITGIIRYFFNVTFDEDSVEYYRFITHLKFFAERLIFHQHYESEGIDDLFQVIVRKYKNSYQCVLKIAQFVQNKYDYALSLEEQLYLVVHIQRLIYHGGSRST